MVCHGELYRLKPDPRHLTGYYLMIAAGGALGGVFVAVAAPLLFTDYYELHWGLFLCGLLFLMVCICDRAGKSNQHEWRWLACALALATFAGLDRLLAWLPRHAPSVANSWLVGLRVAMWTILVLVGGFLDRTQEVPELPPLALPGVRLAMPGPDRARRNPLDAGPRLRQRAGLPVA